MANSEWNRPAGNTPHSHLAIRYLPFAARGKLKAMRPQSTGEPASMPAQSVHVMGTTPRRERR